MTSGFSFIEDAFISGSEGFMKTVCLSVYLEVLQLSSNNISHIDSDALAPLYSLADLSLEGNSLHHLKFKTFISLHTTATHIQLSGKSKHMLLPVFFR